MKEIELSLGRVAIVDDEDFEIEDAHAWHAKRDGYTFYAVRNIFRGKGKWGYESMHRKILSRKMGRDLLKHEIVDHINGDGLDNRKSNLRSVTKSQNNSNCRCHGKRLTSKYIGVCWYKAGRKWVAQIGVNRKRLFLGFHTTELEAALARESFIDARPELHARTNFPSTLWDM
jgi:hypothetical protein